MVLLESGLVATAERARPASATAARHRRRWPLVEPPLDGLGLAGREVVADGDDRRQAGISASSWSRKPMKSHWLRVLGGHGRDLARVHGKGGEQVHRSIFLQAPQVLRADY
jgi:hypothetical protein